MDNAPLDILSPKNDFVFKQLFGDAGEIAPLSAFLQAALGLPEEEFADLRIIDPTLNPEYGEDKRCILDVRVKTRSGRDVDVEIQVKRTREIFNRIQCYTAKMVAGQVKSGESYGNMPQSVAILIADFLLWENNSRYHHRFRLYEPDERIEYPNSMEIHMLELPKIPADGDDTKLCDWLKFISAETRDEFESLAGKDAAMAKAYARLMELSADEAMRLRADARAKWEWDNESRMQESREEGLAKGLAKGKAEERMQIIRQMLEMRMPVDVIAKATGLPEGEIERLSSELQ
jgi:predicted transposase/invertase (TIGR01784 family)